MKQLRILLGMSIILCLFQNCQEVNPKNEEDVLEFLIAWNERHTALKATNLKHDYMDVVNYYGAELTKEQVQQHKNSLFEKFPRYRQRLIDSSIRIERDGGDYLISFTREVRLSGQSIAVPSFLNVGVKNSDFRILREGFQEGESSIDLQPLFPSRMTLESTYKEQRKLYGDFNGDGLSDYAYITNIDNKAGLKGVAFSATDLKTWSLAEINPQSLENLTDLNGDGADEVGVWTTTDVTKSLWVWDARASILLMDPLTINTIIHQDLKLIDVLKKSGPKKIRVTESIEENGVWNLKSRVVSLQ